MVFKGPHPPFPLSSLLAKDSKMNSAPLAVTPRAPCQIIEVSGVPSTVAMLCIRCAHVPIISDCGCACQTPAPSVSKISFPILACRSRHTAFFQIVCMWNSMKVG